MSLIYPSLERFGISLIETLSFMVHEFYTYGKLPMGGNSFHYFDSFQGHLYQFEICPNLVLPKSKPCIRWSEVKHSKP